MRSDFAVMICSHGRAETMTTYRMLRNQGFSGEIIIVIDDEDEQAERYKELYDHVEVFCKEDYYKSSDGVITGKQKAILYARNACYDIAERLGLLYFTEFDDDLNSIFLRYIEEDRCLSYKPSNLDKTLDIVLDMLNVCDAVVGVSLLVQGDYIGGVASRAFRRAVRCCSQAFFLRTDRRVDFLASMNEDTCSCLVHGMRGKLFFGVAGTMLEAEPIGQNTKMGNGMADFYKKMDSFARSFMATIVRPDCAGPELAGEDFRIRVSWENALPYIISERWKRYA